MRRLLREPETLAQTFSLPVETASLKEGSIDQSKFPGSGGYMHVMSHWPDIPAPAARPQLSIQSASENGARTHVNEA